MPTVINCHQKINVNKCLITKAGYSSRTFYKDVFHETQYCRNSRFEGFISQNGHHVIVPSSGQR